MAQLRRRDDRIEIALMNDYSVDVPLWENGKLSEPDQLGLSDGLLADLTSFAARWQASISPEVTDDRWDGVPVMESLVAARYALPRLSDPSDRRRAQEEDVAMRSLGEGLRGRLQEELGDRYRVTYRHF